MSGLRWVAAQAKPNQENRALENLRRQSYSAYCPMIARTVRRARVSKTVQRPLFPGYIFVKLVVDRDPWRPLLSTRGVQSLVMCGGRPGFTPDGFIEELQAYEKSGELDRIVSPAFQVGDEVIIREGPFRDLVARVTQLPDNDRVWLLLDMMGRQVRISQEVSTLDQVR